MILRDEVYSNGTDTHTTELWKSHTLIETGILKKSVSLEKTIVVSSQ